MVIQRLFLIFLSSAALVQAQSACLVETIAGDFAGPVPGVGGPALEAELASPFDVRVAADGSLLIADVSHNAVSRVDPDGILRAFAGTGSGASSGDGGAAVDAGVERPFSVALGPDGSVYFVEFGRIRRVDAQGIVTTVGGDGSTGPIEFGGPAVGTPAVGSPIVVDAQGVLHAVSTVQRQVFRIGLDGIVTLFAGDGRQPTGQATFSGEGGPATDATLIAPRDLVVDSNGLVYILDASAFGRRILRVEADGTIGTYVGGSESGPNADGTPREQIGLIGAAGLEIDGDDNLYWSDFRGIRRLTPAGELQTFAPLESAPASRFAASADGRVFVLRGRQVLEASPDGSLTVLAGVGRRSALGEGGPARNALVESIEGLAFGPDGTVYYAESSMARIRAIRPDGTMVRVAGTGEGSGDAEEGRAALDAALAPSGLAADSEGRLLFSEAGRSRLMRIEADGTLTRIAGDGVNFQECPIFECGDGGSARDAVLLGPRRVAADSVGNIYVSQRNRGGGPAPRDWIRRITPDGTIETPTTPPPARSASSFAARPGGGLLVATAEGFLSNLWRYSTDGEFSAVPGAENNVLPGSVVAVHPNGEAYFEDGPSVRRFDAEGRKRQVVGDRAFGLEGGDGPADELRFSTIREILLTPAGDLIIGDSGRRRIFRIRDAASCPTNPRPQISFGPPLRNGASFGPAVSPGTIFSIFGLDLGPSELATAEVGEGGFPTQAGGVRVLIDDLPAPMIFSLEGQVSGVVPWAVEAGVVEVAVERDGVASSPTTVTLEATSPAFFTFNSSGSGPVAALNQDGTVNTAENPAAPGTIVQFFATGFGATDPPGQDGALTAAPLPVLVEAPTLRINGTDAELLYAGPAPGLLSGVVQLNARVPPDAASGLARVEARSGDANSSLVEVYVGP